MTTITEICVDTLAEMMGDEATEADAYAMMAILSRECVIDTDDVRDRDWAAYLEEAVATAARESSK